MERPPRLYLLHRELLRLPLLRTLHPLQVTKWMRLWRIVKLWAYYYKHRCVPLPTFLAFFCLSPSS